MGHVTGEVGAGKTAACAPPWEHRSSRHTIVYLGNPTVGARGLCSAIVSTLGGTPGPTGPRWAFICFNFARIHLLAVGLSCCRDAETGGAAERATWGPTVAPPASEVLW